MSPVVVAIEDRICSKPVTSKRRARILELRGSGGCHLGVSVTGAFRRSLGRRGLGRDSSELS